MSDDPVRDGYKDGIVVEAAGRRWFARKIGGGFLVDCRCECELGVHRHNLGLVRASKKGLAEAIEAAVLAEVAKRLAQEVLPLSAVPERGEK